MNLTTSVKTVFEPLYASYSEGHVGPMLAPGVQFS